MVTILLIAAGCSFPGSSSQPPSAANQVNFGAAQVDATIHALAQSGVGVYTTVSDPSPIEKVSTPAVPLRFLKWQARNLALDAVTVGGGLSGGDLDQLAPVPADAVPASFLVAAYVKSGSTAGGRYSQRLMGKQDWTQPGKISFPTVVLVLLLADTAGAAQLPAASGSSGAVPIHVAALTAINVAALCQTLANWVDQAFDDLFNLIKVGPSTNPLLNFLGALWNVGVNLVESAVKAAIAAFTAPVAGLIRTVLGAISIAAQAISFLRNMSLKLDAAPAANKYSSQPGSVTATLGNPDGADWPSDLSSCLTSFGFDLKSLNARNHDPVTWIALPTPASAATVQSEDARLDDRNSAGLQYLTGQDSSANCGRSTDFLMVQASIQRDEVQKLKDFLLKWFDGELDNLPGIVKNLIGPALNALLGKIIDDLVSIVEPTSFRYIRIEHEACKPSPSPSPVQKLGLNADACALVTLEDAIAILGQGQLAPGAVPTAEPLSGGPPTLLSGSDCYYHGLPQAGRNTAGLVQVFLLRFKDSAVAHVGLSPLLGVAGQGVTGPPQPVSGLGEEAAIVVGPIPAPGSGTIVGIVVRVGSTDFAISADLNTGHGPSDLPGAVKALAVKAAAKL